MQKKILYKIDSVGFILSMICAVHCLMFPILLVVLPLIGLNFLLNETAEKVFILGSVLVAGFSLFWGYRYHKNLKGIKFYSVGASLLLLATFAMGHNHSHVGDKTPSHVGHDHANCDGHEHSTHAHSHSNEHGKALEDHPQGNWLSLLFLVVGGVCIALSHYFNKSLCKSCPTHRALNKEADNKAANITV